MVPYCEGADQSLPEADHADTPTHLTTPLRADFCRRQVLNLNLALPHPKSAFVLVQWCWF
jgi:hypothetical protein